MQSTATQDKAHGEALRLSKLGEHEQASYYFVNALARNPGDLSLIGDFVACLRAKADKALKQGQDDVAYEQMERASAFLFDRVPFVEADTVAPLLKLAEQFARDRDALNSAPPAEEDPRDVQARQDLKALCEGKFEIGDEGTIPDLQARGDRLRQVLQFVLSINAADVPDRVPWKFLCAQAGAEEIELRGDFRKDGWINGVRMEKGAAGWTTVVMLPTQHDVHYKFLVDGKEWLSDHENSAKDAEGNSFFESASCSAWLERIVARLEMALQFETLLADAHRLVEEASRKKHRGAAALCLQGAEQIARQLATWPQLGSRQSRVGALLDQLRSHSDDLLDKSREEESEAAWKQFDEALGGDLLAAEEWNRKASPKIGAAQVQIERLRKLITQFQELLPKLIHDRIKGKARDLGDRLAALMISASQVQHQLYNEWAL